MSPDDVDMDPASWEGAFACPEMCRAARVLTASMQGGEFHPFGWTAAPGEAAGMMALAGSGMISSDPEWEDPTKFRVTEAFLGSLPRKSLQGGLKAPPVTGAGKRVLTEVAAQVGVFDEFRASSKFMVPGLTPMGWFECDVFRMLGSGYCGEYEIKLSANDFRADFRKADRIGNKHEALAAASGGTGVRRGVPNYFSFVVPPALSEMAIAETPGFYGVYEARPWGGRARLKRVRKPAIIHREKWDAPTFDGLGETFYYRYWNSLARLSRERYEARLSGAASKGPR